MLPDIIRQLIYAALANFGLKIGPPNGKEPPLLPRKLFYNNPDVYNVQLSPDGNTVAFVKPYNGVLNIWVQPFDELMSGLDTATPATRDSGRGISRYSFTYLDGTLMYIQDKDGDENWQLFTINVSQEPFEARLLTSTNGVRASVLATSSSWPHQIIVGLNDRDSRYHDPYKIDLITGEREIIFENNGFHGFIIDHNLEIRLAISEDDDGNKLYSLPPTSLPRAYWSDVSLWPLYRRVSFDDASTTYIMNFDKTNNRLYWVDSWMGWGVLGELLLCDFNDVAQRNCETLYRAEKAEIHAVFWHNSEKTILSVTEAYGIPKETVLDNSVKADFHYLNSLENNNGVPQVLDASTDMQKWIVRWRMDTEPLKYYIYDRAHRQATYLFSVRQDLQDLSAYMSATHAVEITTRDKLTQICYVTVPYWRDSDKDGIPNTPLPMVLHPHGGPWSRDMWGFGSDMQLRANRGYVTMRCNYRGSTGYGKAFRLAGHGEWGAAMHNDLIDAVQWAIDKKIADPEKIAIYGGSYGGYAALIGLTFTPEVFACGVDYVGVSNLISFLKTIPDYWKPQYRRMVRRVGGNPDTAEGREFLKSRSPLFRADKITKPLLIAQGANDARVKQNESDQIVDAMRMHNIPVTYLLFPNEGHGFRRPENKLAFAAVVDQFFGRCLGGRSQPISDELQHSAVELLEDGGLGLPGNSV